MRFLRCKKPKPLLVEWEYMTWFFVSCWNPISVWMYKDCYLRFCSAAFDLEHLHPKIHLCNTAVQRRYKVPNKYRDTDLPMDDVWELKTFRKYLKDIGKEDVWDSIIYPGMKQNILSVMLPAQKILLDSTVKKIRQNSFEIYGADFLLSEDLTPWLLEVNSGPLMQAASSKITKMSKQCLEDCIKIVIDRRVDPEAQTGKFELLYKQTQPQDVYVQAKKGNIVVLGKSIPGDPSKTSKAQNSNKKKSPKKKRNYMEENTVNAEADHSNFSAMGLRNKLRWFLHQDSSQEDVREENKLEKNSSSRFRVETTSGEHTPKNSKVSLENILGSSSSQNRHMSRSRSLSDLSMENNISTPNMGMTAGASVKRQKVVRIITDGIMYSATLK
ncbi:unnamed protein product [Allacma fusca]|uniref:Uncharacterized protein n=1 Tax=Allacma fusca TaxID=39272 RepID=A0A8J2LRN2_9HEXA|nr:unnamed protein product [Allacma fusca]